MEIHRMKTKFNLHRLQRKAEINENLYQNQAKYEQRTTRAPRAPWWLYLLIFYPALCAGTCSSTSKFLTHPFGSSSSDHFIPEFRRENVIKADFILTNCSLFGLFFLLNGKMARTRSAAITNPGDFIWSVPLNVSQVVLLLPLCHHCKPGQRSKDFKNPSQEFVTTSNISGGDLAKPGSKRETLKVHFK